MSIQYATPGVAIERRAQKRFKSDKEKKDFEKEIERRRERDSELVVGIFENKEAPGQSVDFCIKTYPGDPIMQWTFMDGERYSIPRGVARHINTNCYTSKYEQLKGLDLSNRQTVQNAPSDPRTKMPAWVVQKKIHRFSFKSLEFMDDEADIMPSKLVSVTL